MQDETGKIWVWIWIWKGWLLYMSARWKLHLQIRRKNVILQVDLPKNQTVEVLLVLSDDNMENILTYVTTSCQREHQISYCQHEPQQLWEFLGLLKNNNDVVMEYL